MKTIKPGDWFHIGTNRSYTYRCDDVIEIVNGKVLMHFSLIKCWVAGIAINKNHQYKNYSYFLTDLVYVEPIRKGHKLTKIFS